jgi:phospholipase/carboxylesterase
MEAKTVDDALALMAAEPEGLKEARRLLRGAIGHVLAQTRLPMSKVVLGGFSQGAMLATDVALHLEEAPAALVVFSGALIARSTWVQRAPSRKGLAVLQTHGEEDAILPFFVGEALHEELSSAGLDVRFRAFRGPHTIDGQGVRDLAELLAKRLGKAR